MPQSALLPDPMLLDSNASLETILAAWHTATLRLEETHSSLREEVSRLTDELEVKNRELARKNRLADLGQMAAHVAHEVRNNLVPVTLYLSLLRRRVSGDSGSLDVLDKIAAGLSALDVTVNDLLQFTVDHDPQWQVFGLRRLMEDVCTSIAPQMDAQAITAEIRVPEGLLLMADPDMIRRAVLNLALNALDAMPRGGRLCARAASAPWGVELEIADTGEGLAEDVMRRAFEPFFTTKRGGTGLGLAIVDRIAEAHGGSVTVANQPEGGAVFTLRIPRPAPVPEGNA